MGQDKKKKYKIVILEFIDEAQELINKFGNEYFLRDDVKIICFHPKVKVFLQKKGIPSENTLAYLDNDAQHRIILKSETLTLKLVSMLQLRDEFGVEKGYNEWCIHHIRLYLNHLLWCYEIVNSIMGRHKLATITACIDQSEESMYTQQGYIQYSERFLGFIARDLSIERDVEFHGIVHTIEESSKSIIFQKLLKFIVRLISKIDYWLIAPSDKTHWNRIIVPGLSYRMDLLLKDIRARHPEVQSFMLWEGKDSVKQHLYKAYLIITNIWRKITRKKVIDHFIHLDLLKDDFSKSETDQRVWEEQFDGLVERVKNELASDCSFQNVSFLPYLLGKINLGLRADIQELLHSTRAIHEIFIKIRPTLLISMYSGGIYYTMGELANIMGFHALNISHGTHVPPNNEFEKIENYRLSTSVISNTYPYVAVQTPWTQKFLDFYEDSREKVFTGPLLYSVVSQRDREELHQQLLGENRDWKVIVHANTQKGRHGLRFHITETLDEYIATLTNIVHVINKVEKTFLVIRPHPICDLSEEEFRLLLPACDRMAVINTGTFASVLSGCDLLISYSSTCIEEAIQNNIPVALYDQWNRYNHFNVEKTDNFQPRNGSLEPAYYMTEAGVLEQMIRHVSEQGNGQVINESNLSGYCFPREYKQNFFNFVNSHM